MISVSSPKWTDDDELLAELRDALQGELVDDDRHPGRPGGIQLAYD